MSTPVIQVEKLMTVFDDTVIHENLDLTINGGECTAIVGGSGTGKTTLLREILMLHKPTSGKIIVLDQDVTDASLEANNLIRRRCGMMFQQGALFSSLSVLENVSFPLQEFTDLDKQSIEELARLKIALVGLAQDAAEKKPSELSGGMIKRAAIARAIALDPELLFLDEPTAGLDPSGANALDELVIDLKESLKLTVVMVTHDLDTLWKVTDKVAFLGDKRVLAHAPMMDLQQSEHATIKSFFSGPRSRKAQQLHKQG